MAASFAHSAAPVRRVRAVHFGILSPEEVKAASVTKIEVAELYEEGTRRPKEHGLADPRLGTIEREFKCQTCQEGMNECPGHFGHIELGRAVYHAGFIARVKKILECICVQCGKLKLDLSDARLAEAVRLARDPKRRLAAIYKLCKPIRTCAVDEPQDENAIMEDPNAIPKGRHGGCGHRQPDVRREGLRLILVYAAGKDTGDGGPKQPDRQTLSASQCFTIMRKISDDDLHIMGISTEDARPEWMMITVLPVPPPQVRPAISIDGGALRGEDDLTYKLIEIIRTNQALKRYESEGAPAHILAECETLLQWHVATYMDNKLPGQPQSIQRSGRPIKSIRERLKGKEGRLRGNLMGKRVDFSARTVITADPNLELDEVGVPFSIGRNLTYPERVTPYNITYLQELVRNGPNEYPGARYIIKDSGERIDLSYNKRADAFLEYGWIVERHLKDGDLVLFNRQPSLHKMSMMAHRIRLMPYSTFRLNLSVTPPYNADFDGDEMNLHVPQSEETRAELSQIAAVPRQIVSPQGNKPVMGIVQDSLLGIYKFTSRDTFVDLAFVQNLLLWVPEWDGIIPPPYIIKPKPLWTGKQLLSMCIPKGINLSRVKSALNPDDTDILVDDGEILQGKIAKPIVGSSYPGSLVHVIFQEKGPTACKDFLSGVQMVVNFWLLHNGFSIGIGDTVVHTDTLHTINKTISAAKEKVQLVFTKAQEGRLEPNPGMTIRETFEAEVVRELSSARESIGKTAQANLRVDNALKQMADAGSKGSAINVSQISGCVGQQSVEGKRINFGFKYRTLPHFTKDDYSPHSRGFVENSYLRGLTPQEFFFHAMSGREGLIDTAVKTAETGYIQRCLVKALEDVVVAYDGTVRNSIGDVVQFAYGEDGMDGAAIEEQSIDLYGLKDADFMKRYRIDLMDPQYTLKEGTIQLGLLESSVESQQSLDEEYAQLLADRNTLRNFSFRNSKNTPKFYLPVNIRRIIRNSQQIFHIDNRKPSDLSPLNIIDQVRELLASLKVFYGEDEITQECQTNATTLFHILLRSELASKHILEYYHLNSEALEWVIGEIRSRFHNSVVDPGEMCGTLAAQSIGEPATQMTLNTFHFAGVASKNVTLGVPRLKEIINVAQKMKSPLVTIFLDPQYTRDETSAKSIQTRLEHTTLKTICAATEIFYDPDVQNTYIDDDQDLVESFFAIPDEDTEKKIPYMSPWLLRLQLDRAKYLDKQLNINDVVDRISELFQNDMFVMGSEHNSENLVIRCRTVEYSNNKEEDEDDLEQEDDFLKRIESEMLETIYLRGVEGIDRVFIVEDTHLRLGPDGAYHQEPEFRLEAEGHNLAKVLCVDGVDATRTICNNPSEVLAVMGIEAARRSVLKEVVEVIAFDGSYVNHRHLSLLCDWMTNNGTLRAFTRHGINRADTGALMRCSFEETVEVLVEAAALGSKDDCTGVAENVLLGQVAPMGTGAFDIALDLNMLKDVIVDHRLPIQGLMADQSGGMTPGGGMTPYADFSDGRTPARPYDDFLPEAQFSPMLHSGADDVGRLSVHGGYGTSPFGAVTPTGGTTPFSPSSPMYTATSPLLGSQTPYRDTSGVTPAHYSGATSPMFRPSPTSPFHSTSPKYSPTSPAYSPTSPGFSPASPRYSPSSPAFSPSSPQYSPTSPHYSPVSPRFSPTSPVYSPTSPRYSPSSPKFSPVSPMFSPASPAYSPTSPKAKYSPTSPAIRASPTSPRFSPTSPRFSPTSPQYSPTSPQYSPTSPQYTPTSPQYSPTSPAMDGGQANNRRNGGRYNSQASWNRS